MSDPRTRGAPPLWPLLALALLAALVGCRDSSEEAAKRPWLVVGIDGADWSVIERLWQEGRLPALQGLAERGTTAVLETEYGISPVIWTTIATGVEAEVHGITDFLAGEGSTRAPATSFDRKVPALWNMASAARRRVAVLGWWSTWPAEEVRGVLVSDRVVRERSREVWPLEIRGLVAEKLETAEASFRALPVLEDFKPVFVQDALVASLAEELAQTNEPDLMLVYLRGVDVVSHFAWHTEDPAVAGLADPHWIEAHRNLLAEAYERVDQALASVLAAVPERTNVLVLSDHGFKGRVEKYEAALEPRVDLETVLEALGYREPPPGIEVIRGPGGVTSVRLHGGEVPSEPDRQGPRDLRNEVTEALESVRFVSGLPAFEVSRGTSREELTVGVLGEGATPDLLVAGKILPWAVTGYRVDTGTHDETTHGILIAAGPDIASSRFELEIDIFDVTPTLLWALGLPVARDFPGRPVMELFRPELRNRRPLRTIASWAPLAKPHSEAPESEADAEILEELKALGYLGE